MSSIMCPRIHVLLGLTFWLKVNTFPSAQIDRAGRQQSRAQSTNMSVFFFRMQILVVLASADVQAPIANVVAERLVCSHCNKIGADTIMVACDAGETAGVPWYSLVNTAGGAADNAIGTLGQRLQHAAKCGRVAVCQAIGMLGTQACSVPPTVGALSGPEGSMPRGTLDGSVERKHASCEETSSAVRVAREQWGLREGDGDRYGGTLVPTAIPHLPSRACVSAVSTSRAETSMATWPRSSYDKTWTATLGGLHKGRAICSS